MMRENRSLLILNAVRYRCFSCCSVVDVTASGML